MKPMRQVAMPALAALVLSACGGGGGGAGMMPAMPEVPSAAEPVAVAEPEPEPKAEPVTEREPASEPERVAGPVAERGPVVAPGPVASADVARDPATLLQTHDRLTLPDSFAAVQADEAMFLLANIPYREAAGGGGAGLAAASLFLQAAATDLYIAQRSAEYRANHAYILSHGGEEVLQVYPEVVTSGIHSVRRGGHGFCDNARGECLLKYPAFPGDGLGPADGGLAEYVSTPTGDMPFVGGAMRDSSEGVRERGGVDLRYWARRSKDVPWLRFHKDDRTNEIVAETWSGYGAWQEWSGFGLVMHTMDHVWDLYDGAWYISVAGGNLTGAVPSAEIEGTMRGAAVMIAEDFSYLADGAVDMTVRLGADPSFDINIGDWQGYNLTERGEIGRPTAIEIPTLDARNIAIRADGTFDFGKGTEEAGYSAVRGAFYGPGGVEAAGAFWFRPDSLSASHGTP